MDQPPSPPQPSPAEPKRPLSQHPLLGWRGLLLLLVVLFLGVPFMRGLLGIEPDAQPSAVPVASSRASTESSMAAEPRPTATARPAPATPTIGPAAEPADSLDEFRAAELCSSAVMNEVNPDGQPDYNIADVFADQQAQTMRVWNTMTYSAGGQTRTIQYECLVQMQDDWSLGTVVDIQIAEASPSS